MSSVAPIRRHEPGGAVLTYRPRWRPEITGIVPVVRQAILITHEPLLQMSHAQEVLGVFEQVWDTWKNSYHAAVAERSNLSAADLEFVASEKVRDKIDGKTPMIDLPRLRTTGQAEPLDLRNCLALCVDEFSSKVWTRVGPPIESDDRAWPAADMAAVIERFREIASACGEWFYKEFVELTRQVLAGIDSKRWATLEITTVGLQVAGECSEDEFDAWLLMRDENDVEGPNFENGDLCRFITEAANLNFHPRELRKRELRSSWLSIQSTIPLATGELVSRKVLYMVRPLGSIVQIVGVGLDDSVRGDLAGDAALKLSRMVANSI